MVNTLIELYEKEPEYMMQVVERFGKQYWGNKWWKIFMKFLQSKTTTKIAEKKFEILYDEIKENIFTHPALQWYYKKCLSRSST